MRIVKFIEKNRRVIIRGWVRTGNGKLIFKKFHLGDKKVLVSDGGTDAHLKMFKIINFIYFVF